MDLVEWAGLAATALVAALLYAVSGFGFAVLATPLFLLFVEPARAIQLVIIGSLAGLPLGVIAFRHADAVLVRGAVGATILVFAAVMAASRRRGGRHWAPLAMTPGRDFAAGAISGIATALVGMAGPPVLFYLLLTGAAPRTVRATLLSFFSLSYAATLAAHAVTIGVPSPTLLAAAGLSPFAFLGAFAGRPLGDRLGAEAFAILAIALLAVAGLYTIAAAGAALVTRQQ